MRPVGVEQSNSSIVFGEELILKAFRRVEPGVNPELELLRFLSERGFPNIAPLAGWYEYEGRLIDATLGILQEYLAGARDGWELALDELACDPDGLLDRLRALGQVTGELHTALGSDAADPAFAPDEPCTEALSTPDRERRRADRAASSSTCPRRGAWRRSPVAARTCASGCSRCRTSAPAARVIRTHGDYHLGQTMLADRGWVILDFEGEPARPLPERRLKRSPLRDVAGMLRSFSYAAAGVASLLRGVARARGLGGPRARARSWRATSTGRAVAAPARPARRPTSCSRCSSSRRRSTSCATSSTTGPTGSRSRSPGSCGCSRRD